MTERRDPWADLLHAAQPVEAYAGEAEGWRRLFGEARPQVRPTEHELPADAPGERESPEQFFERVAEQV